MQQWKIVGVLAAVLLGLCVMAARQDDQVPKSSILQSNDNRDIEQQKKGHQDLDHLRRPGIDKLAVTSNLGSIPTPPLPSHLGKGKDVNNSSNDPGSSKEPTPHP